MIESNRDLMMKLAEKLKDLSEVLTPATQGGLTVSDIVDNLTSSATDKVLSAKQGKVLNDKLADYLLKTDTSGMKIYKLTGHSIHWDANSPTSSSYTINTITGGVVNSNNVVGILTSTPGLPVVAFTNGAKTGVFFERLGGAISSDYDITSDVIFFYNGGT